MATQNYLTVTDHNRNLSNFRYVYPVVSRRAGGLSIGINLNTNNACNWRCIYCQVPNLSRGYPPPIELDVIARELESQLHDVLHGDFFQKYVGEPDRQLKDIAFSGNGEPTSAKEFPQVLDIVDNTLQRFNLLGKIKVRLITNGSLIDRPMIIKSIQHLARCNGEVWFKLDAGTKTRIKQINSVTLNPMSYIRRLKKCAQACPTFVQTCMFTLDDYPPTEDDILTYLDLLELVKDEIQGVYLYGLARPSMQKEASRLGRLPLDWLESAAGRIRQAGIKVYTSA